MQLPRQEMEEFCAVLLLSNGFSVSSRVAFRVIISQLAIMLHIWQKAISTWLIVFIGRPDSRLFCEISATFVFTLHVIEPSIHSPPFKCSVDQFFFVHCSSVLSYCWFLFKRSVNLDLKTVKLALIKGEFRCWTWAVSYEEECRVQSPVTKVRQLIALVCTGVC